MAVAYDAVSTVSSPANPSARSAASWTHTFGSITGGYIFVWVSGFDSLTVTSVTCGGISLSAIVASGGGYLYGAPTGSMSGAQTVSVNSGALITWGGLVAAVSISGADQSPTWTLNTTYSTIGGSLSQTLTETLTCPANGIVVSFADNYNASLSLSSTNSPTSIFAQANSDGFGTTLRYGGARTTANSSGWICGSTAGTHDVFAAAIGPSSSVDATVTAIEAPAVGNAPTVSISVDAPAVASSVTASAPEPTASIVQDASVSAVAALGSGTAPAPSVSIDANITLIASAALGQADAPVPTVVASALGSFPITGVLDDFNRTAETVLSKSGAWNGHQGPFADPCGKTNGTQALSSQANGVSSGSAWASIQVLPVELYCDLPVLPSSGQVFTLSYLNYPYATVSTGYHLVIGPSTWSINYDFQTSGGSQGLSNRAFGSVTWGAGDSVGMSVEMVSGQGNVTAYRKPSGGSWTSLGSITYLAPPTSGYIGWVTSSNVTRLDNFGGGTAILNASISANPAWGTSDAPVPVEISTGPITLAVPSAETSADALMPEIDGQDFFVVDFGDSESIAVENLIKRRQKASLGR